MIQRLKTLLTKLSTNELGTLYILAEQPFAVGFLGSSKGKRSTIGF